MSTLPKWDEERTAQLVAAVDGQDVVSVQTVLELADALETSPRSISSKLRNLDYTVESSAKAKAPVFTPEQDAELRTFLTTNSGQFTLAEVAEQALNGDFTAKQIQGKVLHLELHADVKATTPKVAVKAYTDEESEQILGLVRSGALMEDIASALGREMGSIRGKILSLSRTHDDISIPKQREYVTTAAKEDALAALSNIAEMAVAAIAEATGKTERGIKTMLTHRGIDVADYKGAVRKAKNEAKAEASA